MDLARLRQRSFVVRYLTLFGGEVASKVCVVVAFGYLARALGPRSFGIVELALSMTTFFVLGAESGLGSYGARIVATTPEAAATLIPRIGLLRALLGLPAYAAILAFSWWHRADGMGILAIYGLLILLTPFSMQWVFQGLRQMQWVATGSLVRYGTFAALVLLTVRPGSNVRIVAIAEVSGAVVFGVFNSALVARVLTAGLDFANLRSGVIDLFRKTWFIGASDITWAVMWYSPTMIVGWFDLGHTEEVAWLAASVRIVMALHTFVWLYFFNLVPNLSKELHDGVDAWRRLIDRSLSLSMWPACFLALAGVLFAPLIMRAMFGPRFGEAVLPFRIVIWMIPVAWFSGHSRFSLIVSGRQDLEFLSSGVAGIATVSLACIGALRFGAAGAAAALLAGGTVNATISGIAAHRAIGRVRVAAAVPAIAACAVALAIGFAGAPLVGVLPSAVVASLLYAVVTVSRWDFAQLRNAWEGRSI